MSKFSAEFYTKTNGEKQAQILQEFYIFSIMKAE